MISPHVRNTIVSNQSPINPRVSELPNGVMFRYATNLQTNWYMKVAGDKIVYLVTGEVFEGWLDARVVPLEVGQTLTLTQGVYQA